MIQTSARPRTLVMVMSDLVTELAMLGPRGNQLGTPQHVPVSDDLANLWRAIDTLGELDRITRVGSDARGLGTRVAHETQRPLRAMTWGEMHWKHRIAGRGVELVVELVPQLRSTLFHDGVEVPGLRLGELVATKKRTFRDYLAPRVRSRKGEEVWNRRVRRAVEQLLAAWSPTTLYLATSPELPVPRERPPNVEVVAAPDDYAGALRVWADDRR